MNYNLADVIKELRYCLAHNNAPLSDDGMKGALAALEKAEAWKQKAERYEKALAELGPFEIVTGDCIWRTSPSSRQVLNSNATWLVSNGNVRGHKLRELLKALAPAADGATEQEGVKG